MLNNKTRELQKEFENALMNSGCDANMASVTSRIDITGYTLREVAQAYAKAVCYAASAHIENCYDTPDSDDIRGQYLTPSYYVAWMNKELSNPLLAL